MHAQLAILETLEGVAREKTLKDELYTVAFKWRLATATSYEFSK